MTTDSPQLGMSAPPAHRAGARSLDTKGDIEGWHSAHTSDARPGGTE
jgi:hypothetical protein